MEHIKTVYVFENIVLMKRFEFNRGKVSGKFKTVPHDPVHDLCEIHSTVSLVI
jgi:hypothetical protein